MAATHKHEKVAQGKQQEKPAKKDATATRRKSKKQCEPEEHEFKFGRCSKCGMDEGKCLQEKQQKADDAIGRSKPDWDKVPSQAKAKE